MPFDTSSSVNSYTGLYQTELPDAINRKQTLIKVRYRSCQSDGTNHTTEQHSVKNTLMAEYSAVIPRTHINENLQNARRLRAAAIILKSASTKNHHKSTNSEHYNRLTTICQADLCAKSGVPLAEVVGVTFSDSSVPVPKFLKPNPIFF